jgi:MoaA/NifB/PqqE/SkfB family radical SAM enzyme
MIKTTAINLVNNHPMLISWDIGRRCNFDCSYCGPEHHNNTSPHADLKTLIKTFEFAKQWAKIYNSHRSVKPEAIEMNFTGGEPTNNPNFWDLIHHIKQDDETYWLGLTTNGTWGDKQMKTIVDYFGSATVSYHCEADKKLRDRTLHNIIELKSQGVFVQVNVMLHTDLWDIAMEACEILDQHGVHYNPTPIGDGSNDTGKWAIDSNGISRRTSHTYTPEQQQWFFKKMNIDAQTIENKIGNKLGRACCGSRCLTGKVDNVWQPVKLVNTEFKDWHCTVDWFFLHIDQELQNIYHHQTCQATRSGRGPIGTLNDTEKLLADLRNMMSQPAIAPIICPNQRCGCGMCLPKAKNIDDFKVIWKSVSGVPILEK